MQEFESTVRLRNGTCIMRGVPGRYQSGNFMVDKESIHNYIAIHKYIRVIRTA